VLDAKIIVNNFQLYIENLLNTPTHHEIDNANRNWEQDEDQMYVTVESDIPELSLKDIKAIVESLKNNKAPGEDNINGELLKLARRDLLKNLYKTILIIWKEEKFKKDWNTVVIYPIYKKGIPRK
jgi:hypothetical protein